MAQIQEQEDEDVDSQPQPQPQPQAQPQRPPANKSLMESSSYPSPHPPPDSPDTSSSISSDHTFHGFSPRKDDDPPSSPPPVLVPVHPLANRLIRDQPEAVTKTEPDAETGFAADQHGRKRRRERRRQQPVWKDKLVKRFGLGLRFFEFVVCLVSFSVMAADKNRGWALDSFDRYTEFRYAMSVNVIGFAYSALQGLDLLCQLTITQSQLRYYFDFTLDQILAYLLLSASSSAFTRVDDWISNWGQDKFPAMASASVGVSFVAFIAFALSSLISGYLLCTHSFT